MPIRGDERIVVYALGKDKIWNRYKPVSLPIRGTYNDYGGIDVFDNQLSRDIYPGSLSRDDDQFVMMHESIHDEMIKYQVSETKKSGHYGGRTLVTESDIIGWLENELNRDALYNKALDNLDQESITALLENTKKLMDDLGGVAPPRGAFFQDLVDLLNREYQGSVPLDHVDVLASVAQYVKDCNDLTSIQRVISHLRKDWTPMDEYSGSQQECYGYYLKLAELMREKCFDNMTEDGPAGVYRRLVDGQDY